ncbi:MAG: DNA-directed RNA polymerase subunit omega [Clostridia bacterium]|nr:DNA-directed RNA polymerase subunit omega [Clostridia bacterium]
MLYPTLESLVNIIGNRYLLVNVTAKRAREIANAAAENGEKLEAKPVRLAVQQIYDEGIAPQVEAVVAEETVETAEEAEEVAE